MDKKQLIILWVMVLLVVVAYGCSPPPDSNYRNLIKAIDATPDRMLKTSYASASNRRSKVELTLYRDADGTLVVVYALPKEAIFTLDEKTGKRIPSDEAPVITMRDHDLDGNPDDYSITPGVAPDDAEYTSDGYVKFNSRRDNFILDPWSSAIKIATKHFLG